jgi:voltage-gated potassium channel
MRDSFRRILVGLGFFLATVLVAVLGYIVAGWNILDATYMVIITIFGVGYGEVQPVETPALKVFTILVIVAGTSASVYLVGAFVQLITEGEINRALGARRKMRVMETLRDHVIICGYGRIGEILARELMHSKKNCVVIDADPERVVLAESLGYLAYTGSATDESVLLAVGVDRAQVLATVLSDDALNVFITLTARELNPNLVIMARGELPTTEKKLRLAGANHVVMPAAIGAMHMANIITHPAMMDFLDQNVARSTLNEQLGQIDMQIADLDIPADSPFVGQNVAYVEVRGRHSFVIVAVRKANGTAIPRPDSSLLLGAGDRLVVIGHKDDIPQFVQRFQAKRGIQYRGNQI